MPKLSIFTQISIYWGFLSIKKRKEKKISSKSLLMSKLFIYLFKFPSGTNMTNIDQPNVHLIYIYNVILQVQLDRKTY